MVQFSGKYKLVGNKNFYEFLLDMGVSEDKAEGKEIKGTLEITVDGNKITLDNDDPKYVTNLVVGQEVDELLYGAPFKSTTAVSGDTVTITTNTTEGEPALTRTFIFSDGGIDARVVRHVKEGKSNEASRTYKRI